MVIDTLENAALYLGLHKNLEKAFAFLREHGRRPPAPGRYGIDGDAAYALVQSYETQPAPQKKWESHRKYIDVQYVCEGEEAMLWAPFGALKPDGEYDAGRDFAGYGDGPATALRCEAGRFVIFFPCDIHKPGCALNGPGPVRKIVIKLSAEHCTYE